MTSDPCSSGPAIRWCTAVQANLYLIPPTQHQGFTFCTAVDCSPMPMLACQNEELPGWSSHNLNNQQECCVQPWQQGYHWQLATGAALKVTSGTGRPGTHHQHRTAAQSHSCMLFIALSALLAPSRYRCFISKALDMRSINRNWCCRASKLQLHYEELPSRRA